MNNKKKKSKQKPDRLLSLANIFLKDFRVANPHRSGIEYDVYLKTVVSGIEKKHLNHLLKDLARKQDLGKKKTAGYIKYKIDSIFCPQFKNSLLQKFKRGHEEMRKKITEGQESIQFDDLDVIERDRLQMQFPGKSDEELREIYWSNTADEEFLKRKVERNIQWLKEHLIGQISVFATDILPSLNLDFDLNFPFEKRLIVAAIKSDCDYEKVANVIDAYFENRKYNEKEFSSAFTRIKTEAIDRGFWDLVEEDKRSYQKFIEKVKGTKE